MTQQRIQWRNRTVWMWDQGWRHDRYASQRLTWQEREKKDFPSGKVHGQGLGKALKMKLPKEQRGIGGVGQGGIKSDNSRSEEQHDIYNTYIVYIYIHMYNVFIYLYL